MPTVEKDKVSMRAGLGGMTQSGRHVQHGEGYGIAVRKLMIYAAILHKGERFSWVYNAIACLLIKHKLAPGRIVN